MKILKNRSLGEKIIRKISSWILILIIVITAGAFTTSYLLSRQMFNRQVNNWVSIIPQYILNNLIDSDDFSLQREVKFLESTGLFSRFVITDNKKRIVAKFGKVRDKDLILTPLQDQAMVVWGYYSFDTDFGRYFSPFLIAAIFLSALIFFFYLIIRFQIKSELDKEFLSFNAFLNEIDQLTENIDAIFNEKNISTQENNLLTHSVEQEIIKRSIARLITEIQRANESLKMMVQETEKKRFRDELTRTALQVTHDIGSPLAALEMVVQSTSMILPEESRIAVRNATLRIRDIANSLLKEARYNLSSNEEEPLLQHLVFNIVNACVAEKLLQYRENSNLKITFEYLESAYGLFAIVRATDFNRVISNLINNSIEATSAKGHINVILSAFDKDIVITIEDNGVGIPKEILAKLGKVGVTYGKLNGSGLGVYHAISSIESWGGRLEINSVLSKGTVSRIFLPRAKNPSWFVPEISIDINQDIVIIDDDQSIHDVWNERFNKIKNSLASQINLHHFYSPNEFADWQKSIDSEDRNIFYLCDYEFIGAEENGIELINRLRLNYLSILVTSRNDLENLIPACERYGIKLLHKDNANSIPIVTA